MADNYIVRIYRYEKDNPRKIVGLVEEPGSKGNKGFRNYDELWEIINPSIKREGRNERENE